MVKGLGIRARVWSRAGGSIEGDPGVEDQSNGVVQGWSLSLVQVWSEIEELE